MKDLFADFDVKVLSGSEWALGLANLLINEPRPAPTLSRARAEDVTLRKHPH